jgi:hypothetical protein
MQPLSERSGSEMAKRDRALRSVPCPLNCSKLCYSEVGSNVRKVFPWVRSRACRGCHWIVSQPTERRMLLTQSRNTGRFSGTRQMPLPVPLGRWPAECLVAGRRSTEFGDPMSGTSSASLNRRMRPRMYGVWGGSPETTALTRFRRAFTPRRPDPGTPAMPRRHRLATGPTPRASRPRQRPASDL